MTLERPQGLKGRSYGHENAEGVDDVEGLRGKRQLVYVSLNQAQPRRVLEISSTGFQRARRNIYSPYVRALLQSVLRVAARAAAHFKKELRSTPGSGTGQESPEPTSGDVGSIDAVELNTLILVKTDVVGRISLC
jgi:hypothetical protein